MTEPVLLRRVKTTMLWTDLGFLGYWFATSLGLISVGGGELMHDWNWSFFVLDIAAITTGLLSLHLSCRKSPSDLALMIISLSLTGAAGLMAVNFYALRGQFDLMWWIPNLWLLAFPVAALVLLVCGGHLGVRAVNSAERYME